MPITQTILDTTAVAQSLQQSGQSVAIAVPDNVSSHRFEAILDAAAQTAMQAGMNISATIQIFQGGNLIYTGSCSGMFNTKLLDGTSVAPHIGVTLANDPATLTNCTAQVSFTTSLPTNIGWRLTSASNWGQLPTASAVATISQVGT